MSNRFDCVTIILRLLLVIFCVAPLQGFTQADSTVLYTLKENERIVYLSEHKLLVTNTGAVHLLFLSRPNGYYILYNKKEFGPYESIGFRESASSLLDWAVVQGGKSYQLILDKGVQIGPYDYVVDVYRSYELIGTYRGTDYTGSHYGFRAKKGNDWYTIVDGKQYGPYKHEPDNGIPHFNSYGGIIRAYLNSYDYDSQTRLFSTKGDSVVLGKIPMSSYELKSRKLYNNGKVIDDNVLYFEEDAAGENYLVINTDGNVSINGIRLEGCPEAYASDYGYYSVEPGFIFNSGAALIYHKKDKQNYYYHTKKKISIGPLSDADNGSLCFTRDANHFAYSRGTEIWVDNKLIRSKGFSLVHDPVKDNFSWLSVKGRTIYQHSLKP